MSPRASRKFSSPPPLSITKNSSPNRRRKLSLNIPIITGGKALDLAALSCSPNGYASMHGTMSPFSKTTLDINKLYVSSTMASKIPDEGEPKSEGKAEESVPGKQGQIRCRRLAECSFSLGFLGSEMIIFWQMSTEVILVLLLAVIYDPYPICHKNCMGIFYFSLFLKFYLSNYILCSSFLMFSPLNFGSRSVCQRGMR